MSIDGMIRAAGACYQAIVEATATVIGFRRAGFVRGEYRLDLEHAESHPLRADLGLGEGQLRPELGFWNRLRLPRRLGGRGRARPPVVGEVYPHAP